MNHTGQTLWGRLITCRRLKIGLCGEACKKTDRFSIGGRMPSCPTLFFLTLCLSLPAFSQDDVILRAMKDELERSLQRRIFSLDAPYFFEYRVEERTDISVGSPLGARI